MREQNFKIKINEILKTKTSYSAPLLIYRYSHSLYLWQENVKIENSTDARTKQDEANTADTWNYFSFYVLSFYKINLHSMKNSTMIKLKGAHCTILPRLKLKLHLLYFICL
jgi:hypothetical protein